MLAAAGAGARVEGRGLSFQLLEEAGDDARPDRHTLVLQYPFVGDA
jgi:hypothetical protein